MLPISVIIITKNEAVNIKDCITAARLITDDIVVVDSGSEDGTIEIIQSENVKLIQLPWKGFGFARNAAAEASKNDWILAIDADERVTPELVHSISDILPPSPSDLYGFKRQNYFMGKRIRFGKWGKDTTYRLYNKQIISWDLTPVHESLVGNNIERKLLKGAFIKHYPVRKLTENTNKTYKYAKLNADKYFSQGKKATIIKRFLSPAFDFLQSFIFFLGFLDGKMGFIVSYSNAKYTWLKYKYLHEMNRKS